MKITTNNTPVLLLNFDQLPKKVQKQYVRSRDLSYLRGGAYFEYEGLYHSLSDFKPVIESSKAGIQGWQGYGVCQLESFSAIVIRYCDDSKGHITLGLVTE